MSVVVRKELPKLDPPSFVLVQPRWATLFAAGLMTLIAVATLFGVAVAYPPDAPPALRYALGAGAALLLAIALRPATWRQMPVFAADRYGIHVVHNNGREFSFIPWQNVGTMTVGQGTGRSRSVLIAIRVTDDEWQRLTGIPPGFSTPAEDGSRLLNIGNACRNPERTLERIEAVRRQA